MRIRKALSCINLRHLRSVFCAFSYRNPSPFPEKYDLRHIFENQEVQTMIPALISEFRILLNLFYFIFVPDKGLNL